MITTADLGLAARLRRLRHHGMTVSDLERHGAGQYVHESYAEVGYNYRMTDLQAAVGLVQLARLDAMLRNRRALAQRYTLSLGALPGVEPPHVPADCLANYQSYIVRLPGVDRARRDRIVQDLLEKGVSCRPGIMTAHRQPPYLDANFHLPVTELVSDQSLILPLFEGLTEADQDRVVAALAEAVSS